MADLEIPDRARRAAREAYDAALQKMGDVAECEEMYAVRAAAPVIVAAELRRLADTLSERAREMREEDGRSVRSSGLSTGIVHLRARAGELDSPGGEPSE